MVTRYQDRPYLLTPRPHDAGNAYFAELRSPRLESTLRNWQAINWQKAHTIVRRFQAHIAKATPTG